MEENYETMVDNIEKIHIYRRFFQVTYYDVYSWEESIWKDKYIKKLSYSEENKAH